MNKKPPINIEIKDEQILLSFDIKVIRDFLRELLAEIDPIQDSNKSVEGLQSNQDVKNPLISTLESFLEQYQHGSVVNRSRYSTFKGTVGETKGKSALYFHLVHNSTLCLSVHNKIIDKVLTSVFYCHNNTFDGLEKVSLFVTDPVEFDSALYDFSKLSLLRLQSGPIEFNKGIYGDDDGFIHFGPYISEQARIEAEAKELFLLPTDDFALLLAARLHVDGFLNEDYIVGHISTTDILERFGYQLISWFENPDTFSELVSGLNKFPYKFKSPANWIDYKYFFDQINSEFAIISDCDNRFFGTKRLKFESVPELRFFLESIAEELAKFLAEPEMPNLIF